MGRAQEARPRAAQPPEEAPPPVITARHYKGERDGPLYMLILWGGFKIRFTSAAAPAAPPGHPAPQPTAAAHAADQTPPAAAPLSALPFQELEGETAVVWIDESDLRDDLRRDSPRDPAEQRSPLEYLTGSRSLREFYAEGGVRFVQGEQIVMAERLYFNFREGHGLMEEAEVRSNVAFRGIPGEVVLRAREMRMIQPKLMRATDAQFTSCPYGRPHYHVHSDQLDYEGSLLEGSSGVIDASGNRVVVGDTTVTPLPPLRWQVNGEPPLPIRSVSLGSSSRFGGFALIRWGGDISHWFETENDEQRKRDPHAAAPFHGEWLVDTNYYSARGFGSGVGFEYEKPEQYLGKLYTFYIKDRQQFDRDNTLVENNDRGWVSTQNRFLLPERFQLDAELSYLSEKHLLNEYFEKVAKEEKEQETYLYLKKLWTRQGATLLGRWRLNEFDSQTEYLPRAAFRSIGEPVVEIPFLSDALPDGAFLYHTNFSEISNARRRASDQLAGTKFDFTDERVVRADTVDAFTLPFDFGPYGLMPFYENRVSYFSRTVDQGGAWRYAGTVGSGLSTQFHHVYEWRSEALGLDGVRHIAIPEVAYTNTWATTVTPNELFAIDGLEDVNRLEEFQLRLDQRLQTRTTTKPVEVRDFLRFLMEQPIFPDERRDNAGHTLGPLHSELSVNTLIQEFPFRNLRVFGETDYDWNEHTFATAGLGMGTEPAENLSLALSYRVLRGISRVATGEVSYRFSPKWELALLEQHDLGLNLIQQRDVTLRRFFHDFVTEVTYSVDQGKGDRGVALSLTPLFLWRDRSRGAFLSDQRPLFTPDLGP
ncbi:MAG: hypothetical protein U1E76_02155 [Planctomycetota bacterium]